MPSSSLLNPRLFSVEDYERMGEAGILQEDDRLELIAGQIVWMTPIGSPHSGTVNQLNALLLGPLGNRVVVSVQSPVRLGDLSMPQPDLLLLRPRADSYKGSHPEPDDVLLLIEVSDSSVAFDREIKLPLYAAFGIAEVWIVNVPERCVEVHRSPAQGAYREAQRCAAGDDLAPRSFPDLHIDLDALLRF